MSRDEEIEAAWEEHLTSVTRKKRKIRARLAEAQNWRCCYCGVRMSDEAGHLHSVTLEHIVPESRGGPTELWNLVAACWLCNDRRADRYLWIEKELRL